MILWKILFGAMFVLSVPLWPFLWLMGYIKQERCPKCRSRWHTSAAALWFGEEWWHCSTCGNLWEVR